METVRLFGLNVWGEGFKGAVSSLESVIVGEKYDHPKIVVTPNVDHLVRLQKDKKLFDIYGCADYIFPDGFPIVLSAKLFGEKIIGRVTGADLFPEICKIVAKKKGKVFVLGGVPGTESYIEEKLKVKYPGMKIKAYAPPFGFSAISDEAKAAVEVINEWQPHVVFVCLGMPKQELWAFEYRTVLKAKLILCVGAALEFDIGLIRRAPRWIQMVNLEWFWRLCSDPSRLWKRYLIDDIAFIKILYREFTNSQ